MIAVVAGCGPAPAPPATPASKPVALLPTQILGGGSVPVFPVNNMAVRPGTGWDSLLEPRRDAFRKVDSILLAAVEGYSPEVTWVNQATVRRAAEQAPGMITRPDQLPTGLLKREAAEPIPESLRASLRQLTAIAAGGRYALVPAELVFGWDGVAQRAYADLSMTLADVRTGTITWSNTLRGTGPNPWTAVAGAVRTMFP